MTRSRRVSLPPPKSSADSRTAIRVIALAMLFQMLRSRRFYERAAVAAIVLAAWAGLNREGGAKAFAGLVTWAKRQDERLERKVKAALTDHELSPPGPEVRGLCMALRGLDHS
jgi:hypothetical protein